MSYLDSSNSNQLKMNDNLLKHLLPINDLSSENRQKIANKSRVDAFQIGETLISSEEHKWFVYLLEGRVELFTADGSTELVVQKSARACHPLFSENKKDSHLVAESSCKIIRFDRQMFVTLMDYELLTGEQLEEIEVDDAQAFLFNEIMHAFNLGKMKLPSLPEIALKIKTAMQNPEVSIVDLVRLIEADPAMAARLIQVANSSAYRVLEPSKTLQNAIVRLGLSGARNLVMAFSVKQLFTSRSSLLKNKMRQLYQHSLEIAAIAYAVAKETKKIDADQLLLAGLIHDIGVIPILSYIDETGFTVKDEQELDHIIFKLRSVVGSMVIKHWGFAAEFQSVVEHAEDWYRDHEGELDVCDIVNVAQIYSLLQQKNIHHLPKIHQVPAFKKLFPEQQSAAFSLRVFERARNEIFEVKSLLQL